MTDAVVRVHPRRSLSVTGFVTFVVIMVPVSMVLYWYASPNGVWPWLLALDILVAILCLATLARQLRVFAAVTHTDLLGNGIFSRVVSVPISSIHRVVLVPVYARNSSDTSVQFMALDRAGHCLFRLRGTYWHASDLHKLATALEVEIHALDDPLSEPEFFQSYPKSRYWFERAR